jgi:hypothetical protein
MNDYTLGNPHNLTPEQLIANGLAVRFCEAVERIASAQERQATAQELIAKAFTGKGPTKIQIAFGTPK